MLLAENLLLLVTDDASGRLSVPSWTSGWAARTWSSSP